ncbi:MAG: hypothetical protein QG610_1247 [Euryarchaeota archaeon]|nr:hypothetical protein [Euryarchaeota archaeon]
MVWSIQVNRCKRRYLKQAKRADRLGPKGKWQGTESLSSSVADRRATGVEAGPNPFVVLKRNVVTPYLSLQKLREGNTARSTERDAGGRGLKKQKPFSNRMDTGWKYYLTRKGADVSLVLYLRKSLENL